MLVAVGDVITGTVEVAVCVSGVGWLFTTGAITGVEVAVSVSRVGDTVAGVDVITGVVVADGEAITAGVLVAVCGAMLSGTITVGA